MDYGKWKFDNKKKEKQNKKKQNKILIKEIQIRTRTDEGDIKIKLQKAREFIKQGHKVKINLRFFGREMAHKELGFKLLKQLEQRMSDVAETEQAAKMERRSLFTIMAPLGSVTKKTSGTKKEAITNKEAMTNKHAVTNKEAMTNYKSSAKSPSPQAITKLQNTKKSTESPAKSLSEFSSKAHSQASKPQSSSKPLSQSLAKPLTESLAKPLAEALKKSSSESTKTETETDKAKPKS